MRGLNFHPAKLAQDGFVTSRRASRTGFRQQIFERAYLRWKRIAEFVGLDCFLVRHSRRFWGRLRAAAVPAHQLAAMGPGDARFERNIVDLSAG